MKKFELTNEFVTNSYGAKLFRIKALITLPSVKAGELGGYIEKEGNLIRFGRMISAIEKKNILKS